MSLSDSTHQVKIRRSRKTEEITKLNKRMKIPKDAYHVVGGTSPGWSFRNSGLTDEELNETENEQVKEIRQLKRQLQLEKEIIKNGKCFSMYMVTIYVIW